MMQKVLTPLEVLTGLGMSEAVARASLDALEQAGYPVSVRYWKDKNTEKTYAELAEADYGSVRMVVYRSLKSGKVYVKPAAEFFTSCEWLPLSSRYGEDLKFWGLWAKYAEGHECWYNFTGDGAVRVCSNEDEAKRLYIALTVPNGLQGLGVVSLEVRPMPRSLWTIERA